MFIIRKAPQFIFLLLSLANESSAFTNNALERRSAFPFALNERKPFIAGNWKLNPTTRAEAIDLATAISQSVTSKSPCDVALFVPYLFIQDVKNSVKDLTYVGAQFTTPEEKGAFTGGISPKMLKSVGVKWTLAGHSERRIINGESDEYINKQCRMLLDEGMSAMLCIGETEDEFEKNLVGDVCEIQLKKGLAGVTADEMSRVAIAYEPVWAIGTGKVATPEIAQKVHAICRHILKGMYGEEIANSTRILYGGSVTAESVDGLLEKPDIDGALVGGASLNAESFGRIINFKSSSEEENEVNEEEELELIPEPVSWRRKIFRRLVRS